MNFVTNHAPDAGSIARPVDQQSSALPLCYGCPRVIHLLFTTSVLSTNYNKVIIFQYIFKYCPWISRRWNTCTLYLKLKTNMTHLCFQPRNYLGVIALIACLYGYVCVIALFECLYGYVCVIALLECLYGYVCVIALFECLYGYLFQTCNN